jgi:hypothetical protein
MNIKSSEGVESQRAIVLIMYPADFSLISSDVAINSVPLLSYYYNS